MRRSLTALLSLVALLPAPAAGQTGATAGTAPGAPPAIDAAQLLTDLRNLSADSLAGRKTGTPGSEIARSYILRAFRQVGLEPFGGSFTQPFAFTGRRDGAEYRGVNIVGSIEGARHPDRYIVLTAHYDHLGTVGGQIHNGADDNASGTAALLAMATYFREHPPAHSVVFAALDAEELGLQGARAFVQSPPVPLEAIALDVNLDMVSRNEKGELYVVGTFHYPFLKPFVERVAPRARVTLRLGHDRPDQPGIDDWTGASDHGAFHAAKVPFLYFGVEDHPDYHKPTDDFEKIDPAFYTGAVEAILGVVLELDRGLPAGASR